MVLQVAASVFRVRGFIFGHYSQTCSHHCSCSEMPEARETCPCARASPLVLTSHTATGNISFQRALTVQQTELTSATGGENRLLFTFCSMLHGDVAVWIDT